MLCWQCSLQVGTHLWESVQDPETSRSLAQACTSCSDVALGACSVAAAKTEFMPSADLLALSIFLHWTCRPTDLVPTHRTDSIPCPAALHNLPAATAAASTTALGSLQAASLQLLHALIRAGGPALLPLADGMARLFKPLLQAVADGAIGPMAHTPRGTETAVQVTWGS